MSGYKGVEVHRTDAELDIKEVRSASGGVETVMLRV